MAAENKVRQASNRFYAALTWILNVDAGPLPATWGHGADVTAMHPLGERRDGWEQVGAIKHRVTTIYRRKGRERTMVHHHEDSLAAMHELVSRLRAACGALWRANAPGPFHSPEKEGDSSAMLMI
jgi:hypothetical protein